MLLYGALSTNPILFSSLRLSSPLKTISATSFDESRTVAFEQVGDYL